MVDLTALLEPEQLAAAHDHTRTCIVHVGNESGYLQGHVAGAVYLPPQALVSGRPPVPGKLPEPRQLERLFGYLGHTSDTHYIVYDDEGGGWAGRFIWTLDVIGHFRWSYLNGGLTAWCAEGLPLETVVQAKSPTQPRLQISSGPVAEIDDILPRLQDRHFGIWDARSRAEYLGQRATAQKSGHIPGAIHCEWTELMDPQRGLRIRTDAESYLRNKGITGEKEWVTHCQSHHRSGFTYMVGRLHALPIRAYHGSWSEWGNHPGTPVAQ